MVKADVLVVITTKSSNQINLIILLDNTFVQTEDTYWHRSCFSLFLAGPGEQRFLTRDYTDCQWDRLLVWGNMELLISV